MWTFLLRVDLKIVEGFCMFICSRLSGKIRALGNVSFGDLVHLVEVWNGLQYGKRIHFQWEEKYTSVGHFPPRWTAHLSVFLRLLMSFFPSLAFSSDLALRVAGGVLVPMLSTHSLRKCLSVVCTMHGWILDMLCWCSGAYSLLGNVGIRVWSIIQRWR